MSTPYAVAPAWPPEPEAGCEAVTRLTWYASQARWAPSKHNSQPWRFIVTARDLEVWADPSRLLVETDARRRELVLSCGAAMHLASVAARAHGVAPREQDLRPCPEHGLLPTVGRNLRRSLR